MKKWAILVALMMASTAMAAPPSSSPTQFIKFDNYVINGKIQGPGLSAYTGRERVRFKRLLRLKKSLLPRIFVTSKERVFK